MPRRPATFTQADINRAAKAAAMVGFAVEMRPGSIRLVPCEQSAKNWPIDDAGEGPNPWDEALAG